MSNVQVLSKDEQPVFDVQIDSSIDLLYGVEDRPKSWWETLFFAFQITLVDFTPFIWAGMFVSLAGLPDDILPTMISTCFLAMGVGTIIQTTIGNRLPIVQGPSSSVLSAMGPVAATYGFTAMWGAVIVGGFIEFIIGKLKILGHIRRFIPPVVTGSVVTVIGFVAARIALTWIFTNPNTIDLMLALIAFLLALTLKFRFKGILSNGFVLISVLAVGVVLSSFLGRFTWAAVAEAPLFAMPKLFPFKGYDGIDKPFIIVTAAIIAGFTGYVGSMFESLHRLKHHDDLMHCRSPLFCVFSSAWYTVLTVLLPFKITSDSYFIFYKLMCFTLAVQSQIANRSSQQIYCHSSDCIEVNDTISLTKFMIKRDQTSACCCTAVATFG